MCRQASLRGLQSGPSSRILVDNRRILDGGPGQSASSGCGAGDGAYQGSARMKSAANPLGNGHNGGLRIAGHSSRHDRCIDNTQARNADHAQPRINDGAYIPAEAARTDGMKRSVRLLADVRERAAGTPRHHPSTDCRQRGMPLSRRSRTRGPRHAAAPSASADAAWRYPGSIRGGRIGSAETSVTRPRLAGSMATTSKSTSQAGCSGSTRHRQTMRTSGISRAASSRTIAAASATFEANDPA